MNNMKAGAIVAVALMLLCTVCIPAETADGDGNPTVSVSSATFDSNSEILTVAGTSPGTFVNVIVTGNDYTSPRAAFSVNDGYYSGTMSLKDLSAGTYTVTASISESVKAEKTFTVSSEQQDTVLTISSVSYASGTLSINGTSPATYVNVIVSGTNYTSQRLAFNVTNGSYSGTASLNLSAGTYTVTASISESVKAEKTFTVSDRPVPATGVSLNNSSLTLYGGNTASLSASLTPIGTTETISNVSWSSSNNLFVSVLNGALTLNAVSDDPVTITATVSTSGGHTFTATCTVTTEYGSLNVNPSSVSVEKGKAVAVSCTLLQGFSTVICKSDSTSIATASASGSSVTIAGVAKGTTDVAITMGSLYRAIIPVTVTEKVLTEKEYNFFIQMKLDADKVSPSVLSPGGFSVSDLTTGFNISATGLNAAEALQKACSEKKIPLELYTGGTLKGWIDSMFGLGDVNLGNGVWKYWVQYNGSSYNQWTLGYYTDGGNFSLIYDSTTMQEAGVRPVTSIDLVSSASVAAGSSMILTATISPADATYKDVTWKSADETIATVDSAGKVIGVKAGTVKITATATDGSGVNATCTVTVTDSGTTPPEEENVAVTGVSLNKGTITLDINGTETLSATVAPSNATNKNVTWTSSNDSVASVNSTGKVTAFKAGTATITVTTVDGSKTASCTVTVKAVSVSGVSLNKTSDTMVPDSSMTLTATVLPADAGNRTVTWSSSDPSVATVDGDGNVKAIAVGTATITVTTVDGSKTASCTITVEAGTVTPIMETKDNEDGSTTTTEGSKIELESGKVKTEVKETTVKTDGSKIDKTVETVEDTDGSKTEIESGTVTTGDGKIIEVEKKSSTDSDGKIIEKNVTVKTEDSDTGVKTEAKEIVSDGSTITESKTVVPATVVKENNTSTAVIEKNVIDKAVEQMSNVKEQLDSDVKPVIEIAVNSDTRNTDESKVTIPSESLKKISEETDAEVKVASDVLTVTFSNEAVSTIASKEGESLELESKIVDTSELNDKQKETVGNGIVYDITATVGTTKVRELNGTATISLPYELKDGEDPKNVTVWYLDENGNIEKMENPVYDPVTKTVSFVTDHFSQYAVGYDSNSVSEDDSGSEEDSLPIFAIAAIVILILLGAGIYVMYSRRT